MPQSASELMALRIPRRVMYSLMVAGIVSLFGFAFATIQTHGQTIAAHETRITLEEQETVDARGALTDGLYRVDKRLDRIEDLLTRLLERQ